MRLYRYKRTVKKKDLYSRRTIVAKFIPSFKLYQMVPLFILLFILPATLPAAELIVWGVPTDRGLMAALRLFEAGHPGWELVTSADGGAASL